MNFKMFVRLVKERIINFNSLILKNYKKLKINEVDVLVLIELNNLLESGVTMLKTKQLANRMNLTPEIIGEKVEHLIKDGYVVIEMEINKNGKQNEVFHLTPLLERIYKLYVEEFENEETLKNRTVEEKIVSIFEKEFSKQISPLEIEIINKWLTEDNFSYDDIKGAMYEAVKVGKLTLNYVDAMLLSKRMNEKNTVAYVNSSPILEELKRKWKK